MAHYEAAKRGAKASAKKLLHRLSGGRSVGNAPDEPEMDEVSTDAKPVKRAAGGATTEGGKPRGRMAKKGGSTVNVIVAGGGQPHPVPVPVPVGGARPGLAGGPPGAVPPAGMPPRPMPPGMPAQKRGGRVKRRG